MDKGLLICISLYTALCLSGCVFVAYGLYHTWSSLIGATVEHFKWDEEKYMPYRILFNNHGHKLDDFQKLSTMLMLRNNYENAAWIKNWTREFNNYKDFDVTDLILTQSKYVYLEYESRDGEQQWRVHLHIDGPFSHYGRVYEFDANVLVFITRILVRIFVYPLLDIFILLSNVTPVIGKEIALLFHILGQVTEEVTVGTVKFLFACVRIIL